MSQIGTNDSKAPKPDQLKPPYRRLVVMFDGTESTRQNLTNVSRMFEAIDDSHPQSYQPIDGSAAKNCPPFPGPASTKIIQCETCNQSMMERAKHNGEANFRAGVPCDSCHQLVVEPELQPELEPELEPVQLVKYIGGSTKYWKWIIRWLSSQVLGYGLPDKIKEGYIWLCDNYEEGDEVFVFGFSRGAFAARSLVSLLCKCGGVLKKTRNSKTTVRSKAAEYLPFDCENTSDDRVAIETAYNYYRAYVRNTDETNEATLPEVKLYEDKVNFLANRKNILDGCLEKFINSTEHDYTITRLPVPVKMLGVWDTVGALGVPETSYSVIDNLPWSRTQYQFDDEGLSCIVQNAYHALALDEHRKEFKPTLWTSQHADNQEVKQVWFVGSHSNVGGGADLDDNDDPDDLWQYSYVWMQRHAEKHGLRFFWSYESPATRQDHMRTRQVSLRKTEPSFKWAGNKYKQETPWWRAWWPTAPPYIREANPELAMLHWSVIERIKVTEDDLGKAKKNHVVKHMKQVYRPPTLFHKGSPEVDGNWHIETDDVSPCEQWGLPPWPKEVQKKEDKKAD